ncbi:MAG: YceI family protein [Candidatus Omnitrophica bacterium]|nr:YceI family protein [Candidatus Omnitrophota bacterium]
MAYVLDQEHSHVQFTGSAMGYRFRGRVQALQGRLDFDPANDQLLHPAEILISVKALTTDHPKRDQDMWTMFEAADYPVIRCVLTTLTLLPDDFSGPSGTRRYRLEGRLKIRTIEQPVAFEVVATVTPERIEASGELPLTTNAFVLRPPTLMLGLVRVRKQVHVEFAIRWTRQP